MTEQQRQNLIANKAKYIGWIADIDKAVQEIAVKGTASASISSGGGSKSYTRIDIGTLGELRNEYCRRVAQIQRRLQFVPSTGIRHVMTVRG